jgi:DNA-directed RNA polymerase specialized sigma24 family protein
MRNYSNRESKKLVEDYEELKYLKGTDSDYHIYQLVRLADLDLALRRLSEPEYEAVLLCGLNGLTARTAGILAGTSTSTMNRRYKRGLESLARYLNNALRR